MRQNLITVKRELFNLVFCFAVLMCFSYIGHFSIVGNFRTVGNFSTVGNTVAASQPKTTVKTAAAPKVTKRVAVVGGVVTIQRDQMPELPSYTDTVLETTIEEDETPL